MSRKSLAVLEVLRCAPPQAPPLIAAKLCLPARPSDAIARPRLTNRLERGARGALSLLTSPAGSGKSSLVREWLLQYGHRSAWLTLDASDNDPARFWRYLLASIAHCDQNAAADARALLDSSSLFSPSSVSLLLLNGLASLPRQLVLVLDNYSAIIDPALHDSLDTLLENLPPQVHVVLTCRAEPPLAIPRLRVRGLLTELHAPDLAFTVEETAAYMEAVARRAFTLDEVCLLHERTWGWAAALRLAALALTNELDPDRDMEEWLDSFVNDHPYLRSYLQEEVFDELPGDLQSFMLHSAVLRHLEPDVCDAVTERDDSRAVLLKLRQSQLFLIQDRERSDSYHFHSLFATFLKNQLLLESPSQIQHLHHRASEWFEKNGQFEKAVEHAIAAAEWPTAARVVRPVFQSVLRRGELNRLLEWLDALPTEWMSSQPQLCVMRAWALLFVGRLDDVEASLHEAISALDSLSCIESGERGAAGVTEPADQAVLDETIHGEVAAVRAYLARYRRELSRSLDLSDLALQIVDEQELGLRCLIWNNVGYTYLHSNKLEPAAHAFSEAVLAGQTSGTLGMVMNALCGLGVIRRVQGDLQQAMQLFRRALHFAKDGDGEFMAIASIPLTYLGWIHYEWNDLDEASRYFEEALETGRRFGHVGALVECCMGLSRTRHLRGRPLDAISVLDEAERMAGSHDLILACVLATRARHALWCGDLLSAANWAQSSGLRSEDTPGHGAPTYSPPATLHYEYATLVRVLIALNDTQSALDLLDSLISQAEAGERYGNLIEFHTLRAVTLHTCEKTEEAVEALERALALAEPGGYVRTFLDEGPVVTRLVLTIRAHAAQLGHIERSPTLLAFCERLSDAIDSQLSLQQEEAEGERDALDELLSDREQEVLRLLATRRSHRQIAESLIIAESTAKWHVQNIYRKLQVNRRTQAVARAHELGLLTTRDSSRSALAPLPQAR